MIGAIVSPPNLEENKLLGFVKPYLFYIEFNI